MHLTWKLKRKLTVSIGIIYQCLYCFEYSSTAISALYYYKNSFNVENPKFYYGCSMAAIFLSAIISNYICGRVMDKTRDLRKVVLNLSLCNILGNLTYTLTWSPWLPVLGRFVCGIATGIGAAVTGEFNRIYKKKKELAQMLSLKELISTTCMALAPCTPLFFYGIHFQIGSWKINQDNFIGIFLASITSFMWIFSYFGLHNLTKDPESPFSDCNTINKNNSNAKPSNDDKLWTTKDILKDRHLMLLLVAEGFLAFQYFQMELEINLMAVEYFHWPMLQLGLITSIAIIVSTGTLYLTQKKLMGSALNIFFLYVVGLVIIGVLESIILFGTVTKFDKPLQHAVIFTSLFFNIVQGFGSTVYCQWLMFSITPSHSSSIVESHRYIIARALACLAFFTASYVYDILKYIIPVYSLITYILILLLLSNRFYYVERKSTK
ncbi:uncharacterized protein [Clytia hemisphaerica]